MSIVNTATPSKPPHCSKPKTTSRFGGGHAFPSAARNRKRPRARRNGAEPHRAMIEARMHAVAVELDFVQPVGPVRRLIDKLGELRPYPFRQSGRGASRHAL